MANEIVLGNSWVTIRIVEGLPVVSWTSDSLKSTRGSSMTVRILRGLPVEAG